MKEVNPNEIDEFAVGSINDYEEEDNSFEELENEELEKAKKKKELAEDELNRELNNTFEIGENETLEQHFKGENGKMSAEDEKKYYSYMESHTGDKIKEKSPREKIEALSKAAAAYMMVKATSTRVYNTNTIHKNATKIKQTLDLSNLHEIDVDDMLSSPENLKKGVNERLNHLYGNEKNFDEYIKKMKTLSENLMSDDNRSKEYKAMVRCIKEVAQLKPGDKDEIISKNYKLMESVEKYMKGKKRVRKTEVGVEHFNNALDALAIMNEYNPMLTDKVASLVDRVNEVRGSELADHKDHVDIADFGAERAVEAKAKRIERTKEKKRELTMDKEMLKNKELTHPTVGM